MRSRIGIGGARVVVGWGVKKTNKRLADLQQQQQQRQMTQQLDGAN